MTVIYKRCSIINKCRDRFFCCSYYCILEFFHKIDKISPVLISVNNELLSDFFCNVLFFFFKEKEDHPKNGAPIQFVLLFCDSKVITYFLIFVEYQLLVNPFIPCVFQSVLFANYFMIQFSSVYRISLSWSLASKVGKSSTACVLESQIK